MWLVASAPTIRVADDDYMAEPDDAIPNLAFDGVIIADQSFGRVIELRSWIWGDTSSVSTSACTFSISNHDGAMDAAASRGLRGTKVAIQQVEEGAAMSTAENVGSGVPYVVGGVVLIAAGGGAAYAARRNARPAA